MAAGCAPSTSLLRAMRCACRQHGFAPRGRPGDKFAATGTDQRLFEDKRSAGDRQALAASQFMAAAVSATAPWSSCGTRDRNSVTCRWCIGWIAKHQVVWFWPSGAAHCATASAGFAMARSRKTTSRLSVGDWQFGEQLIDEPLAGRESPGWGEARHRQPRR